MPKSHRTARELVAELLLLQTYDRRRERAGHDYGGGQRRAEVNRRRRELEQLIVREARVDAGVHAETCGQLGPCDCGADRGAVVIRPTLAELRAAGERVLRPRLARGHYTTPSGNRTRGELERLLDDLETGSVDTFAERERVEVLAGTYRGSYGRVVRAALVDVRTERAELRNDRDRDTVELELDGGRYVIVYGWQLEHATFDAAAVRLAETARELGIELDPPAPAVDPLQQAADELGIDLSIEDTAAAAQRRTRASVQLRLAREALAGPLGGRERAELVDRIAELEAELGVEVTS